MNIYIRVVLIYVPLRIHIIDYSFNFDGQSA